MDTVKSLLSSPIMRRARVPPFKGNLPNELISQQSSFSWCGAQSTAAKKPEHGKPHAADLPFVRLGRRVPRRAQLRELLPLHPRSSPPQPPNRGTARCGTPAGLARHGTAGTRHAGSAWHGTAIPGVRSWQSIALHSAVPACRLAWHGTAPGSAVPACGTGTAQHGAEQHPGLHCSPHCSLARPRATHGPHWGCPALVRGVTVLPPGTSSFLRIHPPHTHPSQRRM